MVRGVRLGENGVAERQLFADVKRGRRSGATGALPFGFGREAKRETVRLPFERIELFAKTAPFFEVDASREGEEQRTRSAA